MTREKEVTFEHIKERLDNDPMCLEFMKLVMELDSVEKRIILYGLKTGDIEGCKKWLMDYHDQKKQSVK